MRRAATAATAVVVAALLSACSDASTGPSTGSGDEAGSGTSSAPPPSAAPQESGPPASLPAPPVDCEATPDAANYAATEVPPPIRPCDIPVALQTTTLRAGQGRNAQDGDTLIVDYVGLRSEDGAVFDDSYTRGVPIEFPLGRGGVIRGWDDGLFGTQAGSMVKLDVPAALAYGDEPPGGDGGVIQPGDALTFVVEVRSVIAPVTADDAPLDIVVEPSVGATAVTVTELVAGEGAAAELGDTVVVHLLLVRGDNQVVVFNTYEGSDPFQIVLGEGETLPGLFAALPGVRVGSTIAVVMSPDDAFGPEGEAQIGLPAGVDLIAIVEIVGVY